MTEVSELPIWTDCPFRKRVPEDIEIRKGEAYGEEQVVLVKHCVASASSFHVAFGASQLDERGFNAKLRAALNNLDGAARQGDPREPSVR